MDIPKQFTQRYYMYNDKVQLSHDILRRVAKLF